MKRNNWFVPVIIAIGLALIGFSLWAPQSNFNFGFNQKYFAILIEKTGTLKVQNSQMTAETEVDKSRYKIDILDVLRTEDNSEALLQFENGSQFRLAEKSEVVLDVMDNGVPLVVIRTGDIFVEKFGEKTSFWVRSEGQLYSSADYVLVDKKSGSRLKEQPNQQKDREQLSQLEIENTLNSKKADFFKCYGQLIQKTPQAAGQVLISFTIEQRGSTSKVEVSYSDINENSFKSCVSEVVSRTKFRSFSGAPVATVFPLRFE